MGSQRPYVREQSQAMTITTTPCSCGGDNPNCYRCWGTGMVEPATRVDNGSSGTRFKAGQTTSSKPKAPKTRAQRAQSARGSQGASATSGFQGSSRLIHVQPTPPPPVKQPFLPIVCPECGAKMGGQAGRLEKHIAKVHSPDKAALALCNSQKNARDAVPPVLHRCRQCGVMVKSLEQHALKTGHRAVPPIRRAAADKAALRMPPKPVIRFGCRHCISHFATSGQLASHLWGVHGQRLLASIDYRTVPAPIYPTRLPRAIKSSNKAQPSKANKSSKAAQSPLKLRVQLKPKPSTAITRTDDRDARTKAVEKPNNLDAKYGWGGSFRDNGQFGSYPSHDGMDDESFA